MDQIPTTSQQVPPQQVPPQMQAQPQMQPQMQPQQVPPQMQVQPKPQQRVTAPPAPGKVYDTKTPWILLKVILGILYVCTIALFICLDMLDPDNHVHFGTLLKLSTLIICALTVFASIWYKWSAIASLVFGCIMSFVYLITFLDYGIDSARVDFGTKEVMYSLFVVIFPAFITIVGNIIEAVSLAKQNYNLNMNNEVRR